MPGSIRITWRFVFRPPIRRLFCEGLEDVTLRSLVFDNVRGTALRIPHRVVPTARPGVTCVEFREGVDELCVDEEHREWMLAMLRKNRVPARYRRAGTDEWMEV